MALFAYRDGGKEVRQTCKHCPACAVEKYCCAGVLLWRFSAFSISFDAIVHMFWESLDRESHFYGKWEFQREEKSLFGMMKVWDL